jgi:hypothetical protein
MRLFRQRREIKGLVTPKDAKKHRKVRKEYRKIR